MEGKVAITGGIGSGKSFICQRLESHGIEIYDCDRAAKRIIATSADVRLRLRTVVGDCVFNKDNSLNKTVLSAFLLKSESNAHLINSIVHPVVATDFINSGLAWMECAILFSSGFNKYVDKVICVSAPIEVRIARIMKRDGITSAQAYEWVKRQLPQEVVLARSDFEIINDGAHDVEMQIEKVLKILNP